MMEYMPGKILQAEWPHLSQTQKGAICLDLKRYLEELRSLPSPGYLGGLGGRNISNTIFWTADDKPIVNGPFLTEEAMKNPIAEKQLHLDTFNQPSLLPWG